MVSKKPDLKQHHGNVVLSGFPRGGTTLSCYLLGKLPNTVALNEPIHRRELAHLLPDHEAIADYLERYFQRARERIETEGLAVSKHIGGELSDATFGLPGMGGRRRSVLEKGEIAVDKDLSPGFPLVIKHPSLFTALLPALSKRFACYAIVRNPLSVLASRNSLGRSNEMSGKLPPVLQMYAEDLKQDVASANGDALEVWMRMLSWACERYKRELPDDHIVRYEDVVASRGKALSSINPAALELDEPLRSRNLNELYDSATMLKMGERLLKSEGAYWHYYSREDVERLLQQIS